MLQNYWKIPIIIKKLTDLVNYCTSIINPPRIQGYYISSPKTLMNQSSSQFLSLQQYVISLLLKGSGLETFVVKSRHKFSDYSIDKLIQTLSAEGWKISKQRIKFSELSGRISSEIQILFATHSKDQNKSTTTELHLIESPQLPNRFHTIRNSDFDSPQQAIPYVGENCEIKVNPERQIRELSIELYLYTKSLPDKVDVGYQVYHTD
jgi:hypothetical protein